MHARCMRWRGFGVRRATTACRAAHSTSSYAEVLVSCQPGLGREGVVVIDELLESYGRPSARDIHEDLLQRTVRLTDAHRTELLLAYQCDLFPSWAAPTLDAAPSDGDAVAKLHAFFTDLRDAGAHSKDAQQQLFSTYLRMLLHEPSVPSSTIEALLESSFTTHRTSVAYKDLMLECFAVCAEVARGGVAVGVLTRAKAHRLPIDHHTVDAFLAAAASGGDASLFHDAVEEVESYPFLGAMLRRSPHFYGALLRAVAALPARDGFDYVEDVVDSMAEHQVEFNLRIYQHLLTLCTAHGDEERGLRVLDEALEVSHAKQEEFDHFEAACINFYTRVNRWEAAQGAIRRADVDGKLSTVPVLLIAAVDHLVKRARKDVTSAADAVAFVARHEAAHREGGTWADVRGACLRLYTHCGDVRRSEALFDEIYLEDRLRYLTAGYRRKRRELYTLAYDSARARWRSDPRLEAWEPGLAPVDARYATT